MDKAEIERLVMEAVAKETSVLHEEIKKSKNRTKKECSADCKPEN